MIEKVFFTYLCKEMILLDFLYDLLDSLYSLPRQAKLALGASVGAFALVIVAAIVLISGQSAGTTYTTPESAVPAGTSGTTPAPTATENPDAVTTAAAEVPTVLPQTEDAGRSYLDETLFIGDSNTVRYTMYADDTGKAFSTIDNNIGVVSMGVQAITTLKCEQFKGSSTMYTIPDAVAMLKPRRIIICFGTNNLGGSSTDATNFISTYLTGLQAIQTAWPYADIIVSAIPPLDQQRENTNLTMTQVDAYNAALVTMCEENGFKFLNSAEVLRDSSTGWAKKDYTLSDGVHLSKEAVTAYFNYVRCHAYITEDRRPQPLGDIPTPAGTPANLITQDPIAVRGAKVPVEFVAATGGTLSGTTSQLVKKGGTASAVTAVPDSGYEFAGWTASNGATSGSATISYTVPTTADAGGVVLTAHFTAAAHDHDYVELSDTVTKATCLTAGHAKYKCSVCGEIIEKETPALGHDWDDGTVTEDGTKRIYRCRREGCDATKEEILATPTPSPTPTPTPTDPPATPEPTATATPTQEPTPEPHTHSYQETERVPPTCGQDGYSKSVCSCGDVKTEAFAATGQHTWQETSRTEAQIGVDGAITYTCSVCGAVRTEVIPALAAPESPSPEDGGSSAEGGEDTGEPASSEAPSDTEEIPAE